MDDTKIKWCNAKTVSEKNIGLSISNIRIYIHNSVPGNSIDNLISEIIEYAKGYLWI